MACSPPRTSRTNPSRTSQCGSTHDTKRRRQARARQARDRQARDRHRERRRTRHRRAPRSGAGRRCWRCPRGPRPGVEAPGIELVQAAPGRQRNLRHFCFNCVKLFRSPLPHEPPLLPSIPPHPARFVEALWRRRVEFLVPAEPALTPYSFRVIFYPGHVLGGRVHRRVRRLVG